MKTPARACYDEAFAAVERVIALSHGFTLVPVEVDGPDAAHDLVAHLDARGCRCVTIEPLDEAAWNDLHVDLAKASPDEDGAVVVIGRRELPQTTGAALRLVNLRRDTIAAKLRRPLLWCGPASFLMLTWERAPDFWSVRTVGHTIAPDAPAEAPISSKASESATTIRYRRLVDDATSQNDAGLAKKFRVRLVESLVADGNLDDAARVLCDGPALDEDDADAALARFEVELRLGDLAGAQRTLVRAARPASGEHARHAELALAHARLAARYADAGEEGQEAAQRMIGAVRPLLDAVHATGDARSRALALLAAGRMDRSLEDVRRAIAIAEPVSPALAAAGRAHLAALFAATRDRRAAASHLDALRAERAAIEADATPVDRAILDDAIADAERAIEAALPGAPEPRPSESPPAQPHALPGPGADLSADAAPRGADEPEPRATPTRLVDVATSIPRESVNLTVTDDDEPLSRTRGLPAKAGRAPTFMWILTGANAIVLVLFGALAFDVHELHLAAPLVGTGLALVIIALYFRERARGRR